MPSLSEWQSGYLKTGEPIKDLKRVNQYRAADGLEPLDALTQQQGVLDQRIKKEPRKPNLFQQAVRFGGSLVRHAKDSFTKCSQAQIQARLAICQQCPNLQNSQCVACGCTCSGQSTFLNKLAWRSEQCPLPEPKWGRIADPLPVTVVIPTHNHTHYLPEAIQSAALAGAAHIVVVDDSSIDNPQAVCESHGVSYHRVESHSVHVARMTGLRHVETPFVLFLDADNRLQPEALRTGIEQLRANPRAAGVYPDLQRFGDRDDLFVMPDTPEELERANCCDAGTLWRTDAVRQTGLDQLRVELHTHEDWLLARTIQRLGWELLRGTTPLLYRVTAGSLLAQRGGVSQYDLRGLAHETVTIFLPLCGRWQHWPRMRDWLLAQAWPPAQTRIVISDNSHLDDSPNFAAELLPAGFAGVSVYRETLGEPAIAELPRGQVANTRRVNTIVAGIYNRAFAREISTEYTLILEDDVFPSDHDAIERMLREMNHDTGAVAIPYLHRDHPDHLCAWPVNALYDPINHHPQMQRADTRPREAGPMGGAGFGCLLLRGACARELFPVHGNGERVIFYDVDFFQRLEQSSRWRAVMLWDRWADHVAASA